MERKVRVLPPEVLMEEYRKLLQEDGAEKLPLIVSGNSMAPFLAGGRDTVFLSRLCRPAKKGDVLLYKRDSGRYILHRVYKIEGESLVMLGDAQTEPEYGIKLEQVIAIALSATRKGKIQKKGSFWWEFFEKIWIRAVFLRKPLFKGYGALKKLLNR